jgi:hypothetical protein
VRRFDVGLVVGPNSRLPLPNVPAAHIWQDAMPIDEAEPAIGTQPQLASDFGKSAHFG